MLVLEGRRALLGTHVEYAPGQLLGQLEQQIILLGVVPNSLGPDLEESHVADEVEQLVEADVLVGGLLAFLLARGAARLDVPDVYGRVLLLHLHSRLFVDGLEQGRLPPPQVLPDRVLRDQLLQLHFAFALTEVISDREQHEHLRIVGIQFASALHSTRDTASKNPQRHKLMDSLFCSLSSNSLLIRYFCRQKMKSFLSR